MCPSLAEFVFTPRQICGLKITSCSCQDLGFWLGGNEVREVGIIFGSGEGMDTA